MNHVEPDPDADFAAVVTDAARSIRLILPELVGSAAAALDAELARLLDEADSGRDVADEILSLLRRHEQARRWLAERVRSRATSGSGAGSTPPPEGRPRASRGGSALRGEKAATRGTRKAGTAAAYALLQCEDVVVADQPFTLDVGLSAEPPRNVIVERPLAVPNRDFDLSVDVHAEGFALEDGESWHVTMRVTKDDRFPRRTIHLTPDRPDRAILQRTIRASYAVEGQVVGVVYRPIVIARSEAVVGDAPAELPAPAVEITPQSTLAPDLTARLLIGEDDPSTIHWIFSSRFESEVAIPPGTYPKRVGDAKTFLRSLVDSLSSVEPGPAVYPELIGMGRRIAGAMPREFFEALRAIYPRVKAPPAVLFLSEEPYVPWELAVLDEPLDPALPPFLGAQASVGRWILADDRPKLPPPPTRVVESIVVVSGDYTNSDWDELPEANGEAEDLEAAYGASPVAAELRPVLDLLSGKSPADLLHFAVHGEYDSDANARTGLIMTDGETITGNMVLYKPLAGKFVFLNACQVGAGNQVLGGAAGLAQDFVKAGASGVVAPLWSVEDTVARELAREFYQRVLGNPSTTPAEALRACRARFVEGADASPTVVAYQFFGGPRFSLERPAT